MSSVTWHLCCSGSITAQGCWCPVHPALYPTPSGWGWPINGFLGIPVESEHSNPGVTLALCPEVLGSYPPQAHGLIYDGDKCQQNGQQYNYIFTFTISLQPSSWLLLLLQSLQCQDECSIPEGGYICTTQKDSMSQCHLLCCRCLYHYPNTPTQTHHTLPDLM